MYIMDSNQYAVELVTYSLVLVVYFYELIVYMLLERNTFDSIAFFSQCSIVILKLKIANKQVAAMGIYIYLFHLQSLLNPTILEALCNL